MKECGFARVPCTSKRVYSIAQSTKYDWLVSRLCSNWSYTFCPINGVIGTYLFISLQMFQSSLRHSIFSEAEFKRDNHSKKNFECKNVIDDSTEEIKLRSCLGPTCLPVPELWLSFCLIFCHFVVYLWLLLKNLSSKDCDGTKIAAGDFLLSPKLWKIYFYPKKNFISLFGHWETGKSQLTYKWLKIGIVHWNSDKNLLISKVLATQWYQKKIANLEFL